MAGLLPVSEPRQRPGDRFPSLSIADAEDGGLLLHCFAGCGFIDIVDKLKRRGLVDGRAPVHPAPTRSKPKPHDPDPEALKIWVASRPLQHSIAAEYLERRGISLQPPSLRCRIDVPALVAGVQRPDGKIVAIQQLKLTNEGDKADILFPRLTTGALGAGAVRFGAGCRGDGPC